LLGIVDAGGFGVAVTVADDRVRTAGTGAGGRKAVVLDVSIDVASIALTPIAKRRIPFGPHVVVLRTATGAEQQFPVTATAKPIQIDADFSKPSQP
jgi:hypothetical protein